MSQQTTDRELLAEVTVASPPSRVWAVLTNQDNLCAASPELVRMRPLKSGGLRPGQIYLGINRRKAVVWPTRNRVIDVVRQQRLSWDTLDSGARWIYELEPVAGGTRLTQRRPVPKKLTTLGKVVAATLLGGGASHANEVEAGMATTLDHLKDVSESG